MSTKFKTGDYIFEKKLFFVNLITKILMVKLNHSASLNARLGTNKMPKDELKTHSYFLPLFSFLSFGVALSYNQLK